LLGLGLVLVLVFVLGLVLVFVLGLVLVLVFVLGFIVFRVQNESLHLYRRKKDIL